ncbi:CocE/NonD family hydrolase [Bacteroidota bacterium]
MDATLINSTITQKKSPFLPPFIHFFLFLIYVQIIQVQAQESLHLAFPHDDFEVREEMVPMRDGIKLYTLIIIPKGDTETMPIILQRTPYNATRGLGGHPTARLDVSLGNRFFGNDYIYIFQDIRGRFKSEGEFVMFRPPRGQFNDTETDETTDAWDAIDWLVKNVSSNGKVCVWGTSYPGWLTLAAMKDPHPALAAAVPFNPVVDVWKADDWFHWGAFRGSFAFDFIFGMETRTDKSIPYPYEIQDNYTWLLGQGALGPALGARLDKRHKMWPILMENPSYGPYWKDVAADQWFDQPSRLVPALHVHGFWDQEDIYGSPAVYEALEKHDKDNDRNFFVAGPWYHGQHFADGSKLGALHFDGNTSQCFRKEVLAPFLRRFLHQEGGGPPAPVFVFETGMNRWCEFEQWPPSINKTRLFLKQGYGLSFTAPTESNSMTEYISDPEHPVPYAPRPNWPGDYGNPPAIAAWRTWLVKDQRFVDGRPDVATWVSEPLKESLTIRGGVLAHLIAETSGTDADWVVKLIDVYPDDNPDFVMSGYQLMVTGDIFRGRYREDYEKPIPLESGKPLSYEISLPHANHTFLPGHRLMVQVQSTWFPLYDLNPQTFVPSIMFAPPELYKSRKHRVHHSQNHSTYLELNVDK